MFPWLHPSIVHFAIGLAFAGVFLDVVALVRHDEKMQLAGFWNTVLGAAATLLAVLTDEQAKVRMMAALTISSLAEAAATPLLKPPLASP